MRRAGFLLLALLSPAISRAQQGAPAAAEPRDDELSRLRASLGEVKSEEDSALGQLSRLELAERIGRREAWLLDRQVNGLQEEARRQEAQARVLDASIGEQRRSIAGLFLAALRQRRRPALIRPLDYQAQAWHRRYGGQLARLEKQRIERWRDQVRELRQRRARLESQARELRRVHSLRADKGREVAALRARYQALLGEVGRRRKAYEEGLAAMSGTVKALPASRGRRGGGETGAAEWRVPVKAKVSVPFGPITDPEYHTKLPHPGLDYDAADGTPVRAAADGKVALARYLEGYGETVILEHPGGYLSIYAHLRKPLAGEGDPVARGALVGLAGDTGSLRGAYLYFEIRRDGEPVDPRSLLDRRAPPARKQGRKK